MVDKSGPANHVFNTKYKIGFDTARIIVNCSGYWKRNLMESIEIIKSKGNSMNHKEGPCNMKNWHSFIERVYT